MTPRSIIRVLLSLLLLMSQQMAISHTMTHWAGTRDRPAAQLKAGDQDQDGGVSSAFAQGKSCQQCLAFAQIAGVVGNPARCLDAGETASCAPRALLTQPGCARTVCVFQPRAPPSFA